MPESQKLIGEIEDCLRKGRAALWGVADLAFLRGRFPEEFEGAPAHFSRAVVFAVRLLDEVLEEIEDRPTPLYLHHYRQVNYFLDRLGLEVATILQSRGHRALPVPASQILARNSMRGMLSHKKLAWAAGLGWTGRSGLLVTPRFGARVRLASVLTDAPLDARRPINSGCGECRACVAVCPAAAIHTSAEDFDISRCEAKLTEFARMPFVGQHICGVCVKACRGKTGK